MSWTKAQADAQLAAADTAYDAAQSQIARVGGAKAGCSSLQLRINAAIAAGEIGVPPMSQADYDTWSGLLTTFENAYTTVNYVAPPNGTGQSNYNNGITAYNTAKMAQAMNNYDMEGDNAAAATGFFNTAESQWRNAADDAYAATSALEAFMDDKQLGL